MIGVLVCNGCGAHWNCPTESPDCLDDLRCTDCRGTLRPEDLQADPCQFPFPLGTSSITRLQELAGELRNPHRTRELKQLARREYARLMKAIPV